MSLSDLVERLGKTIFEAPFDAALAPNDAPELAEIRLAVIEEIRKKGQRVGGRIMFPFNVVRVLVRGAGDEESALLKSSFVKGYFEQEIRKSLGRAAYQFPDDLAVEFETAKESPGARQPWFTVAVESRPSKEATAPTRRTARLVVVRGKAAAGEILLSKERTNIGRGVEVYRADGPSRRNDLAFTEENATVSREHAHILYSKKTGEYRLFNDRWYSHGKKGEGDCGLWIIRDGLSADVHRNARGVKLETGDEIQLGQAIVRFQMR